MMRACENELQSANAGATTDLCERLADLTRQLAAKQQVIDILMTRVEQALNDSAALKRAQAEILQSSKLTAIGQLAAGIAHEINTPIQYVSDNTYFLERGFKSVCTFVDAMKALASDQTTSAATSTVINSQLAELQLDYVLQETPGALEQSVEGLHRVSQIVSAMKAFSHPSRGAKAPTDLADCITSTATIARNVWKYVAQLKTDLEPGMPMVPCIRDELNQVLLNLIVNAADAISDATNAGADGLGCITVGMRRDGGFAEIRVSDTGTGIPDDFRHRIFEPFFTTKAVGKGTGQGLAIAYDVIVDKHQGTIAVDTTVGGGTTFTVRLPLAREDVR